MRHNVHMPIHGKTLRAFHGCILVGAFFFTLTCGAKNLLNGDSSFETCYGDWTPGGVIDGATAFHGAHSLKNGGHTQARYSLKPGQAYTFSVYLKADKPQTWVRLVALRTDWSTSINKDVEVGTDWKRYSLQIPPQKIDSWNTVWLIVDHPDFLKQPDRNFWLDACQFEEGEMTPYESAEPVSAVCELESPVPGNIFYPEEPVALRFNVFNNLKEEKEIIIAYQIKDYYERKVQAGDIYFKAASLTNITREIKVSHADQKGFYVVSFSLADNQKVYKRQKASFCIVQHPLPYREEEGSLFALSSVPDERIPAAERMGTKTTAHVLAWNGREKGKLDEGDIAAYGKRLERLLAHNIRVVGRIDGTPVWAREYGGVRALMKKDALAAYEDFVYQVISRYKDKTRLWTNWGGEDDLTVKSHIAGTGKSEVWVMDRLAAIMKAGYRGAKRADSGCCYGGLGLPSGVDCSAHFPFTRRMFELAGDSQDWMGLDCYTWPRSFFTGVKVQSPEELGLTNILNEALSIIGEKKRCWITEYGFALDTAADVDSPLGKQLAAYMARSFILVATVPRIERVDWFSCWDCVEGGATYDMWRWPNPMPIVAAYSALAQVLTGARNPREIGMGRCLKAYVFEKKDGSAAFVWSPDKEKLRIEFTRAGRITVLDLMGNVKAQSPKALEAGGSPLCLVSQQPADELARVLSAATIDLVPVEVELRFSDSSTITAYLINQLNTNLDMTLNLSVPIQGQGVRNVAAELRQARPCVIESVKLSLPAPVDVTGLSTTPVTGKIAGNTREVAISEMMPLMKCGHLKQEVNIDGDLSDWAGSSVIELKDLKYIEPPDAFSHKLWTGETDLSVRAYVGWDEENFYFAAEVTDDIHVNKNADKEDIWNGDCVQLALDPKNDALTHESAGYKDDDHELTLGWSQTLNRTVLAQHWPPPPVEPQAEAVVRRGGTKTRYELAIPWKQLGITPAAGKVIGFNFVAPDEDFKTTDYWMGLTPGICNGKKPAQFRKFILTGP